MGRVSIGMDLTGAATVMAIAAVATPTAAWSAPGPQARPEIFTRLLDCRTITESAARLVCYDRQVAAIDAAAQRDEVVVLDKEGLTKTRRSLFGFSFPKLPFLGSDNDEMKPEFATIVAKISATREVGYGNWSFRLEDGAQWQSVEPIQNRAPRPGMTIEIKRGTLGSFVGKIGSWPAFRMKRIG
jgi:hypothetical protein